MNTSVEQQGTCDLVLANIKHRHWIRDLENYVTGKSDMAQPLDVASCQLGIWLKKWGHVRYEHHPSYNAMIASHRCVHGATKQLVNLFDKGLHREAEAGLSELIALRNHLISAIQKLAEPFEIQAID